jgi:hypothetical protein
MRIHADPDPQPQRLASEFIISKIKNSSQSDIISYEHGSSLKRHRLLVAQEAKM